MENTLRKNQPMTFEESGLRFEFSPSHWSALFQYDQTRDFLKIRDAVPKTKGVDFVGIFQQNTMVLMEVKNFRGSRITNKPRIEQGDDPLEVEIAQKFKDTVAGVAGGSRNSTHFKADWIEFLNLIKNEEKRVDAVLWLEEDLSLFTLPPKVEKRKRNTFTKNLKKGVAWLTPRVFLANHNDNPYPGSLTVNFL